MKKYMTPMVEMNETVAFEMMALSIQNGTADESPVLSRDEEWNVWDENEE